MSENEKIDELNACIKCSHLWNELNILTLTTMVRIQINENKNREKIASMLINIGNGQNIDSTGNIKVEIGNIVEMRTN